MSLYFQATPTQVWARRGQTPTVRVATQRDHQHFYGALDVCSGHECALTLPKQLGEMTCHFLDHLIWQTTSLPFGVPAKAQLLWGGLQSIYPGQALLILWDRAKWHKGVVVRDYLSQHPHLQTLHFPPSNPQLNLQKHVWELTRDAVSHNHTRKNFPALVRTLHRYPEMTRFKFEWVEKYVPPILLAT